MFFLVCGLRRRGSILAACPNRVSECEQGDKAQAHGKSGAALKIESKNRMMFLADNDSALFFS